MSARDHDLYEIRDLPERWRGLVTPNLYGQWVAKADRLDIGAAISVVSSDPILAVEQVRAAAAALDAVRVEA